MAVKRRYAAALQGQGLLFRPLQRLWASIFSSVRAVIIVPTTGEKLELEVGYDFKQQHDHVTLTRKNWQTGERSTLYSGPLTNGVHAKPRAQRD